MSSQKVYGLDSASQEDLHAPSASEREEKQPENQEAVVEAAVPTRRRGSPFEILRRLLRNQFEAAIVAGSLVGLIMTLSLLLWVRMPPVICLAGILITIGIFSICSAIICSALAPMWKAQGAGATDSGYFFGFGFVGPVVGIFVFMLLQGFLF